MSATHVVLIITIIIFMILIATVTWIWTRDPYQLVEWWNQRLKSECDLQDANPLNGIPSYHDADNCPNTTATELHRLIKLYHDDIVAEVMEAMKTYDGLPMNEIDPVQKQWLQAEDRWRPIWVRFMGDWAGSADRLPTLKHIVSLFPDVPLLHVSVFHPGAVLSPHRGISRAVHRYHYGLKVPKGDIGLNLAGHNITWNEKEGFIWDDTLPHSAWNRTTEPRIIIFADVMRDLSYVNYLGSKLMYSVVQRTKHVTEIKERLQSEGIVVD